MPMERETHESLLNELNNPETDHTRRTEILQELRTDYVSVVDDFTKLNETNEHLKNENTDLVHANSKLFRQAGIVTKEDKENEQEKELSETITIEDLEGI